MHLEINKIYKLLISDSLEADKEYTYYICVAELDEYYLLNEVEQYFNNNGYSDLMQGKDLDEEYQDNDSLDMKYFKQLKGFECLYYKTEEVEHPKEEVKKKKFTIV